MLPGLAARRRFADLTEQEILALAISSEEDDARIYRSYAQQLRADYPASAAVFDAMAAEEDGHRQALIDRHRMRFGDVIPLIRREHVAGFYARKPVWLVRNLKPPVTPSAPTASISQACPHCSNSVQSGWKACPYCGEKI